ncbi:siderophore-interacting protein [Arcanobacterium haemolyticum]|nr:siderophore-interacting protein [Arcanobacterium haemolyticum]
MCRREKASVLPRPVLRSQTEETPVEYYRFFRARVQAIADITPSFRRFTFTGPELADFGDPGFDQRIKVVFAELDRLHLMPQGEDWYTTWRELPEEERLPFRTYTTRSVRAEKCEVDIDMVVHDVNGPASAWIHRAQIGDDVLILGPTQAACGVNYGMDFVPPAHVGHLLLVGDETAAPAIARILEEYDREVPTTAILELPVSADRAYLPDRPGCEYIIGTRENCRRHEFLVAQTRETIELLSAPGITDCVADIDIDNDILWEVPRTARGGAALSSAALYAWLAGEASAVRAIRRYLVQEHGVNRKAVAFMGYWRLGKAEA